MCVSVFRAAALQQLVDNKIKYNEIRQSQNPYDTHAPDREEDERDRAEQTTIMFSSSRPKTAPGPSHYVIEDSDEDDDDVDDVDNDESDDDEEFQTVVERAPPQQRANKPSFENRNK